MATERLPMRKIREILRQKWVLGHRHRAIARALGIGVGTVSEMTRAASAAGLDWTRVQSLSRRCTARGRRSHSARRCRQRR
jgi:transposase